MFLCIVGLVGKYIATSYTLCLHLYFGSNRVGTMISATENHSKANIFIYTSYVTYASYVTYEVNYNCRKIS